jgi:hypothetical protein
MHLSEFSQFARRRMLQERRHQPEELTDAPLLDSIPTIPIPNFFGPGRV